jgi:hypothetical protein
MGGIKDSRKNELFIRPLATRHFATHSAARTLVREASLLLRDFGEIEALLEHRFRPEVLIAFI